jgi:hypothetical protein
VCAQYKSFAALKELIKLGEYIQGAHETENYPIGKGYIKELMNCESPNRLRVQQGAHETWI